MSFHTLDCVSVDKFNFSNQPQRHKKLVQTYMFFLFLQYLCSENIVSCTHCRMIFFSVGLFSPSVSSLSIITKADVMRVQMPKRVVRMKKLR